MALDDWNNKTSTDYSRGRKICIHYETSGELRNDWDVPAVFIKNLMDREIGEEARDPDPEYRIRDMTSHTDQQFQQRPKKYE